MANYQSRNYHAYRVWWSSESLLLSLDENWLHDASVIRYFRSGGASKDPRERDRGTVKAVDVLNTVGAEISQNARATPRVSTQRSAGVSDPDDSAHRGEWVCHSGRRAVLAAMRMASCAASSRAVRIGDAQTPETSHDKPHEASCHGATNEVDSDCTSSKKTLAPGGTRPCEVVLE